MSQSTYVVLTTTRITYHLIYIDRVPCRPSLTAQKKNPAEPSAGEHARNQFVRHGGRSSRRRTRRAQAAGVLGQPVRAPGAGRAAPQGAHRLRVRRGGPHQQERPPPRLQPRARQGPRAPPRRQARLRVHAHRAVPRRGLPRLRPRPPPRRPPRPRRRALLGRLRRRPLLCLVDEGVRGDDGRGEGGGDGSRGCCAAEDGGRVRRVLQGQGLLRRRRPGVRGHCAGWVRRVDTRVPRGGRRELPGRCPDPVAGGLGRAFCRARRRQGGHPGRRSHRRVRQARFAAAAPETAYEKLTSGIQ